MSVRKKPNSQLPSPPPSEMYSTWEIGPSLFRFFIVDCCSASTRPASRLAQDEEEDATRSFSIVPSQRHRALSARPASNGAGLRRSTSPLRPPNKSLVPRSLHLDSPPLRPSKRQQSPPNDACRIVHVRAEPRRFHLSRQHPPPWSVPDSRE